MKGEYSTVEGFAKIKELRERLQDVDDKDEKFCDSFYLHRWLIQKNFKVDQAEQAIRESIIWRKEEDVDSLAEQEWGFGIVGLAKDFPVSSNGVSKSGQPVITINGEGIDFRALLKKYGRETLLRYNVQLYVKLEKLLMDSHKKYLLNGGEFNPSCISQNANCAPILISNYKNLSMWNATSLDVACALVEGAKVGMKYFPCLVSCVKIINTNKFSSILFKTVKPIFATSPYYTVDCYDTDVTKWSKVILEKIDANQLTVTFGGCKSECLGKP